MNSSRDNTLIKRVGCLAILAVLAITGYFVSLRWVDYPFAAKNLDKEWTRAQKNGIPLTRDDLKPNPMVEPAQNAALVYVEVSSKLMEAKLREGKNPNRNASLRSNGNRPDEQGDNFKRTAPYLDAIVEASKKPYFWVNHDLDQGIELALPEFSGYREVAKGLAYRAKQRTKAGDLKGSMSDLQAGYRMAHHLSGEKILIGQMVSVAIYSIETAAVESIACDFPQDSNLLKQLRTLVLDPSIPPNDIRPALKGEMYFGLTTIRNLKRYGGPFRFMRSVRSSSSGGNDLYVDKQIPIKRTGKPEGVVARAFMSQNLAFWNAVIESDEWKSGDGIALGAKMDQLGEDISFGRTHRMSNMMNEVLLPVFTAAGASLVKLEAKKRTLHSLLLVLEFRARTHHFPKDLKEASAEAFDPFLKDTPLHYKTDGKSATIWSVSTDKKDDGGDPKRTDDVVSTYPSVQKPTGGQN